MEPIDFFFGNKITWKFIINVYKLGSLIWNCYVLLFLWFWWLWAVIFGMTLEFVSIHEGVLQCKWIHILWLYNKKFTLTEENLMNSRKCVKLHSYSSKKKTKTKKHTTSSLSYIGFVAFNMVLSFCPARIWYGALSLHSAPFLLGLEQLTCCMR